MKIKFDKCDVVASITMLYFLVLIISMLIGGYGKYNSAPVICFILLYARYFRNTKILMNVFLLSLPIILFSFYFKSSCLHIVLDFIELYFVYVTTLYLGGIEFKQKSTKLIFIILIILISLSMIGMMSINFYNIEFEGLRYAGVFTTSGNTSASIFCVLVMLAWEINKRFRFINNMRLFLLLLLSLYFIYVYKSGTRTLLFAVPYWLLQIYNAFPKVICSAIILPCIYLSFSTIFNSIGEKVRLKADASYNTRLDFYIMLLDGIKDHWAIIPHGSHSAWDLIRNDTDSPGMSAHNDFLKYIYDWGVSFWLLLIHLIKTILANTNANLNIFLVTVTVSGFALHNILFLSQTWMPYILILILNKNDIDHVSCRKKIQ